MMTDLILFLRYWGTGSARNGDLELPVYLFKTKQGYKTLKLSHYTPEGAWVERKYSSNTFSTSALDGGEWSASRPGRSLAPGKGPPVPIVQEAEWAPEPVWTQTLEEKSFCLCRGSNLDRLVVQPVTRHTDWATRLTKQGYTVIRNGRTYGYRIYREVPYEMQGQTEVPVWYTGIYRPIPSTGYRAIIALIMEAVSASETSTLCKVSVTASVLMWETVHVSACKGHAVFFTSM
jgi:hypothetical protein